MYLMKPHVIVKNSVIIIPDYDLGDCMKLENLLSVWNRYTYSQDPLGYYYDMDRRIMYVPRGMDLNFIREVTGRETNMVYDSDSHSKIDEPLSLHSEPRDELQQNSIAFLRGTGQKFQYSKGKSQLALTLTTGAGKTYCTIAAIVMERKRCLVTAHNKNIKNQWLLKFLEYTDIREREIVDITGSADINKLMKRLTNKRYKESNPYTVFICTRRTLVNYGKRHGWEKLSEFIQLLDIGFKVHDEAHLEFEAIRNIDFFSNTWKTLYLTANLEKSDFLENKVYKEYFNNVVKFGKTASEKSQEKNIIYVPVLFNSEPVYGSTTQLYTNRGLSVTRYADYLMESGQFKKVLEEFLLDTMDFKNMNGQVLVMSSSINSTIRMSKLIQGILPDISVGYVNSELEDEENDRTIKNCTVICSTPKAMGTGKDIPGLRMVINTEPYKSRVTANQVSGRLRYTRDGVSGLYVEFVDMGFETCRNFYNERKKFFKQKARNIAVINTMK